MSNTALTGALGFAPQSAKATAGTSFKWYKANNIDFGPVIDERPYPQEIGGALVPNGAYRSALYAAGGLDMLPRLEGDLGWLLAWLLGKDPTTTADNPVVGANRHRWTLTGTEDELKWGTIHTITPGSTDLGMIATDCKVSSSRIVLPQNGPVQMRSEIVGRMANALTDTLLVAGPSGAGWTTSFEDYTSVPISCVGGLTITGVNSGNPIPVTGVSIDVVNSMTTPAQEMIVGSYFPDDFTPVARTITIRASYKWPDPTLFRQIFGGGASATTFATTIFDGAATIEAKSPNYITGTTPFELEMALPHVAWQIAHPRLAGANIIMTDLIGTAILVGGTYATIDLFNDTASYTWP